MSFSTPKIIDPLRLSLVLSGVVFIFFIIGIISILTLSWIENKNYVRSLSHTVIKTQMTQLENGNFRDFVESLGQEFPNIYISIHDGQKIFNFGKSSYLTSCHKNLINSSFSQRPIRVKICKPLAVQLSGLIPLVIGFLIVLFFVVHLAFKVETRAIASLVDFLGSLGLTVKNKLSFNDVLSQIKFLQNDFLSLKKKMLFANEQQTKSKIAAYLAHDLRSPLLVFQEVLRLQNSIELNEIKPKLFSSISRIQFMINGLKDNEYRQICLAELHGLDLRNVITEMKILAKEKNIKLICRVRQENVSYILDREKIERSIVNLLQNGIEAARTMVVLETKVHGKDWVLRIIDDGFGIPQEFESLIYQEHFTQGKTHGTGLGLSYVKEVVNGHQGSLCHYRQNDLTVFEIKLLNCVRSKSIDDDMKRSLVQVENIEKTGPKKQKNVLVILANKKLQIELESNLLSAQWAFRDSTEEVKDFSQFTVLYSDEPEAIKTAATKGLKPIVALLSDTANKAFIKVNRVLGSNLEFET